MTDIKPSHYALLGFEGIALSFPQDQVLNINSIDDMQAPGTTHQEFGSVRHHDSVLPVFAFSDNLQPKTASATEHRFCVSFHIDGVPSFAIACDTVEPLAIDQLAVIQPLPEPMKLDVTPIRGLLQHGDRLALRSDAGAMHAYLEYVGVWNE